ncbi:M15 family metallopeptidase [Brevibacillus laterosporus]|uniref:M15 family metallopeptidase n=1 Tax=Brevibacillus laterosporus TaxID=1465 RepID=UPI0018CD234E|nr:M15 family metallopeptidase [Brevibacillus laterosporus]MBG9796676.1 peptidase M15 [Brevibacillus laterosporus]MCR8935751.1 M15 family metallopeptidase [Brevibacillus laterosporus]MCZ0838390.1 M15 family metallopeptidase [Brevibacillus laterosporus]MCZ0844537.1 M15 family metallopeptidase [Brevibacillus laterosporus]MED1913312.1 M15 family metallopeptidase [Brevibacillus laterosporus]
MKRWFLLLFILLLLGYTTLEIYQNNRAQKEISEENNLTIKISRDQVHQGNLLLVNKEIPVHEEGVKSDVVNLSEHKELVKGYKLFDENIYLSKSVAQLFMDLVSDAKKDNVRHFIINSGFRNSDEQNELYEKLGSDYALPDGYSEHNLGLSLDIGSTQMKMDQASEGKWLKKNAYKYGFILRYPKEKVGITGTQYEPWHYRFVGWPHSAIIREHGFVLEEYLDYLKTEKSISFNVHGEKYDIYYYPVSNNESSTIKVPANRIYEISGNNIDGVIVTIYPRK